MNRRVAKSKKIGLDNLEPPLVSNRNSCYDYPQPEQTARSRAGRGGAGMRAAEQSIGNARISAAERNGPQTGVLAGKDGKLIGPG